MTRDQAQKLADFIQENDLRYVAVEVTENTEGPVSVVATHVDSGETVTFLGAVAYYQEACQDSDDADFKVRAARMVIEIQAGTR